MKHPRIWFNRERPTPMYFRFLETLQEQNITEFTTKMAYEWYQQNKTGSRPADYSAIYPLILNPLKHLGYVKSVFKGSWQVLQFSSAEPVSVTNTAKDENEEFFDYCESKIQGKEGR